MENEAPKYASWVPTAGGYVANGKVVSKSPQYDAQGKLKLDIDTSILNNATKAQPQVANTVQGNTGITTANLAGSGTDANAAVTNIGANTSLNLNTANPLESVISTPATKSPVAGTTVVSPEDKINKDYQDAAARNDYQGMINALVERGLYDGQDYSTQIDNLTKQREQKIINIDDQYLAQYQQAKAAYDAAVRTGDENLIAQAAAQMNNILAQQQAWRDSVGFQSAMDSYRRRGEEELQIRWENTYMDGVNQITQTLTQLVGNYLNFQYDPTTDASLRIAQGYVASTVKEQAISTGTFYSSFTQSAIAKATAELVPVYEKMAKDEQLANINLLQQTASFLMNLEQTQFNMWRDQIELQWAANQEKRKEWQQALDSSNARGYVNNQEALILGIEPGALSQKAREHEQELQEELDREERKLLQDMALADYKNGLEIDKIREEAKWADWKTQREYQYKDDLNYNQEYYKSLFDKPQGAQIVTVTDDGNGNKTTITTTGYPDGYGGYIDVYGNPIGVAASSTSGDYTLPQALAKSVGTDNYALSKELNEKYNLNNADFTKQNTTNEIVNMANDYDGYVNTRTKAEAQPYKIATASLATGLDEAIQHNAKTFFGSNEEKTGEGIKNILDSINNSLNSLSNAKGITEETLYKFALDEYRTLFDAIKEYGTGEGEENDFDFNAYAGAGRSTNDVVNISGPLEVLDARATVFNQGDKAKEDAMISIINDVIGLSAKYKKGSKLSDSFTQRLAEDLSKDAYEFSVKSSGYAGLKKKNSWKLLAGKE